MLFNSLEFLLFFPIIGLTYFLLPKLWQRNALLLIGSYYFYMCWNAKYALLLFTSTVITYIAARLIIKSTKIWQKKACVAVSVAMNLSILVFFKYYTFLSDNVTELMKASGLRMELPHFDILLPVGISFYIFQALGYTIDVYRGVTKAERNFFVYALFVSFFPQLVAGPIERSTNLLRQFKFLHRFNSEQAIEGLKLMAWGYFLKLALADRCAITVNEIFNHLQNHESSTLVAVLLFPFQIYGDFAGYTFIAIGCAKIMGFSLMDNFRHPYFAATVTEFWHRWHISLSTWFRDYVYIPLGGNRVGKVRCYINVMITFILSGIWHGANWTFILWGTLHGILQCIERFIGWHRTTFSGVSRVFHITITFVLVAITWVFFRANNLVDAIEIFRSLGGAEELSSIAIPKITLLVIFIVLCKDFIEEQKIRIRFIESHREAMDILYLIGMALLITEIGEIAGGEFIYFQF